MVRKKSLTMLSLYCSSLSTCTTARSKYQKLIYLYYVAVYMANGQYKEACKEDLPGIELLEVSAKRYVKENHIKPKNPGKWDNAFPDSTVFTYSTNFEVAKTEFFHRPEVRNWTDYILGEGGIYKYRWGDAPLRFLTLALFAEDREVLHRQHHGIHYCHPC